jgi:hypothetical protein
MNSNFTSETVTETITKHVVVLSLNEDDIAQILVDPRPLQKHLREVKSAWHQGESAWSATGHADRRPRNGKAKRAGKTAEKKSRGLPRGGRSGAPAQICPHCRDSFKRLAKHLPACPERPGASVTDPLSE